MRSLLYLYSLFKGYSKKVYFDLDHLQKCGFWQGIRYIAINTFTAFLNVAKFWPFWLYVLGILGAKYFKS